ncbi:unnamed protein product, partial [Mesorhabditis spiculigera]
MASPSAKRAAENLQNSPDFHKFSSPILQSIYQHPPECDPYYHYDVKTNTCVSATIIQFEDQINELPMQVLHGIAFPILSLVTLVMNGAVIAVLRQQNRNSPTVGPLEWMAVSACLMATSPLPFIIYYYHIIDRHHPVQHIGLCHLEKICMQVLPFFFNTLTTFFTLLLGIQRFIAVQYPLECSRWCSIKVVRAWAKIILFISFLLTALHFFADSRVIYHFCIPSYQMPNEARELGMKSMWVARCYIGHTPLAIALGPEEFAWMLDLLRLCLLVIPSSFLFVITILLIRTIRIADSSRLRESGGRHRRGPRASAHTTMMLAVVISLFLLARLPITILILIVKISELIPSLGQVIFVHNPYLIALNNLLFMTVHPITFGLYMLMSKRFRVSLRKLFGCRFLASDADLQMIPAFSSARMQSIGSMGQKKSSDMSMALLNGSHKKKKLSRAPPTQQLAEGIRKIAGDRAQAEIGIICGSGLGELGNLVEDPFPVSYDDIPAFPPLHVPGHKGIMLFGRIAGHRVVCLQGRFHPYEYDMNLALCALPVRVMHQFGIKTLFVSNAAGGMKSTFRYGDLMLIKDHIFLPGLAGQSPLVGLSDPRFGPRFVSVHDLYDKELRKMALHVAEEQGIRISEGIYVMCGGPQYETPAEVSLFKMLGADALGMSTCHEVVVARQCGIKVLGMSLITNIANFDTENAVEVTHEEVLQAAKENGKRAAAFVKGILAEMKKRE